MDKLNYNIKNIFSISNLYENDYKYKVITILGIKLKFKLKSTKDKYLFVANYEEALLKRNSLEGYYNEIENLILGSSHGSYAYNPNCNDFNLCMPSQDLYYSYKLYNRYSPMLPELKNIILFYSVFSSGFDLEKCSEHPRCLIYHNVFGILPKSIDIKPLYKKYYSDFNITKLSKDKFNKNYRGKCLDVKGCSVSRLHKTDVADRVKGALKNHYRNNEQHIYLNNLISEINTNKQRLYIVISPVHSDYRKLCPEYNELFQSLFKIVENNINIKVIDCYNLDFDDKYFWDYDHLNPKGAAKLTKIVSNKLNK